MLSPKQVWNQFWNESMFKTVFGTLRSPTTGLNRSIFNAQLGVAKRNINRNVKRLGYARFNSSQAVPKPNSMKWLMQTYGYSALGVYLALTALDLPLCFLMVHSLGEERIKVYMNRTKKLFGYGTDEEDVIKQVRDKIARKEQKELNGEYEEVSWWENFKESTLLAEFLIAYGIHKSLIVVRLPLTAAITPATVRILQKWGFNIGNGKMLKTLAQDAKQRFKTGNPNDFIKTGPQNLKKKVTKGQKWFNGLM